MPWRVAYFYGSSPLLLYRYSSSNPDSDSDSDSACRSLREHHSKSQAVCASPFILSGDLFDNSVIIIIIISLGTTLLLYAVVACTWFVLILAH